MNNTNDNYYRDLVDNAIDYLVDDIQHWREEDTCSIVRENIDNLIDQYADRITGNDTGAAPGRIYTADARDFYEANADTVALCAWCKEWSGLDTFAKACAENDYNTLDVLECLRIYEARRDDIVDAVCDYYKVTE